MEMNAQQAYQRRPGIAVYLFQFKLGAPSRHVWCYTANKIGENKMWLLHKLNKFSSLILLLFIFLSLFGCAKFKEGECIQNTSEGTIWRITSVRYTEYTLQAWIDGKWGRPVEGPFDTFDSRYVKVSCPFSVKTIQ